MTRTCSILCLSFLLLSQNVWAHKEWVHQYQVKQAYLLLQAQLGQDLPAMSEFVGLNAEGPGTMKWRTRSIVAGAWREDMEDVDRNNTPRLGGRTFHNKNGGCMSAPRVGIVSLLLVKSMTCYSQTLHSGNTFAMYEEQWNDSVMGESAARDLVAEYTDQGSWLGARWGIQAVGGPIGERWSVIAGYEYRFPNIVSIPVEFHYFKRRPVDLLLVSVALRLRAHVFEYSIIYGQGGLGTGILGFPMHYALGGEFGLSDRIGVSLSMKKVSGLPVFLSTGLTIRISGTSTR
jgi:hypothetical protein